MTLRAFGTILCSLSVMLGLAYFLLTKADNAKQNSASSSKSDADAGMQRDDESGSGESSSATGNSTSSSDSTRGSSDSTRGSSHQDLIDQALVAYAQKDPQRLDKVINEAARQQPTFGVQQLLEALRLSLNQDVNSALQLLHSAANDPNAKPAALACAGELLFQTGDFQNAEPVLHAALAADPNQPNPHRYLAAFYYDVGAMDDALMHLERVAELDTQDARPWRMRGMILSDFERHPEAIEAYRSALDRQLQPHVRTEVVVELAASLLATRQPESALEQLSSLESTAEVESLRAECQLSLGDYDSARTSLKRVLELEPTNARGLMTQATLAREEGNLDLAKETLEFAVATYPFEFDFRAQFMSVLAAQGDADGAQVQRDEMQRLQGLRTRFTELHHESMRDPNSPKLRFELGQTAEELGKFEMAVSWYRAALALDPGYQQAESALRALATKLQGP